MTTAKTNKAAQRIAGQCLAGRARLISRAVSGLYEEELRPHGITTAQTGILAVVAVRGESRPSDVASILCLEKSTLSRNLDRMIERGWVEVVPGDDARSQRLRVTAKGARLVERIAPAWRSAQQRARALLGEQGAAALHRLGQRLIGKARL